MLSFLTPLYLLAGLAILAPIVAHLVRKKPREVMDFSSVIFLEASPPRLTNRKRVDQWLLLALRSLILLALAIAFARPYLNTLVEQKTPSAPAQERVLLIDASASMCRDGVWEQALLMAKQYIEKTSPEDSIAVYAMTDRLEALYSIEESQRSAASERKSLAAKSIQGLTPTWRSCDLGKCMLEAIELLNQEKSDDESRSLTQVAIVSDFQQGSSIDSLGSAQWPQKIPIVPLVCQPKNPGNATASILPRTGDFQLAAPGNTERVLVRNATGSKTDQLTLRWLDSAGKPIHTDTLNVFVPAGQQQMVTLERPTIQSARSDAPLILELSGDEQPFDNRMYFYRGSTQQAKAACLDSQNREPKDSLWYFPIKVPVSQPGLDVQWEVLDPDTTIGEQVTKDLRLLIASSDLTVAWAQELKESIENGLHVWWILDRPVQTHQEDPSAIDPWKVQEIWKIWFPEDSMEISEAPVSRFHLLENIDMSHPIFSAFSDPKFNDFTKIRFWKHRQLHGAALKDWRLVASFDDGHPALLERSIGKGKISVLTSGWQPIESQLALSSKFVPVVVAMFEQASPLQEDQDFRCGDKVPDFLAEGSWHRSADDRPDIGGKSEDSSMMSRDGVLTTPGLFANAEQDALVAVNLPRSEGLTDPIDLEEFARFGISIEQAPQPKDQSEAAVRRKNQLAEQLEANQGGWWWILLAVLTFAGLESLIAASRTRFWASQMATQ